MTPPPPLLHLPGISSLCRYVFKMAERIATGVMSSQKSAPVAVTGPHQFSGAWF